MMTNLTDTMSFTKLITAAIEVADQGITESQSPFGAVIADNKGDIVAQAYNRVRCDCDSTAHAEIAAIRAACNKLGTVNLTGYVIASTCEPCPMCSAAIHWARLDTLIYGAEIADAKRLYFNEMSLSAQLVSEKSSTIFHIFPRVMRDECLDLFSRWQKGPNPNPY